MQWLVLMTMVYVIDKQAKCVKSEVKFKDSSGKYTVQETSNFLIEQFNGVMHTMNCTSDI